jgi:ubiquinone biosynthesis protein COQ4
MVALSLTFLREIKDVKPIQALRSVRALIADPQNTGEVFKVIAALEGGSLARAVARLEATAEGRQLLRNKPDILTVLSDREALRAMPEGSVGRNYLKFVELQSLSADGLVAASEEAPRGQGKSPEERWLGNRLRDIHDLQHVVYGYGRDTLGELCLLSFMVTQTPNRGIAFIIFMARRQARQMPQQFSVDDCIDEGRRIGEAATWFVAVNWETRLAEPLEQLRHELGKLEPELYRAAIRSFAAAECAA